jgi:hypothetical protein
MPYSANIKRCDSTRRNDAMAVLLSCQMLSGFFSRYDFGKEAIRTLTRFTAFNTGKVASTLFLGVR